jgi:hypothetical protein
LAEAAAPGLFIASSRAGAEACGFAGDVSDGAIATGGSAGGVPAPEAVSPADGAGDSGRVFAGPPVVTGDSGAPGAVSATAGGDMDGMEPGGAIDGADTGGAGGMAGVSLVVSGIGAGAGLPVSVAAGAVAIASSGARGCGPSRSQPPA